MRQGGTGYIIEYFGEGIKSLSATGMATVRSLTFYYLTTANMMLDL